MTEVIKKLENYNSRMKTAISELETLEYDAEFLDEIARRYWFIVFSLHYKLLKLMTLSIFKGLSLRTFRWKPPESAILRS